MDEALARRRGTRTLVALLLFPPLAPVAWAWWSGDDRPRHLRAPLFRLGLSLLVAAPLPLLSLVVLAALGREGPHDPRLAGVLLLAGWTVATICMTAGATLVELERRRAAADR